MKKSRFLSLLLAICLTVCLAPRVSAAENTEAEQAIIDACTYQRDGHLTKFDLTKDTLKVLVDKLYTEGRLPWYASNGYEYKYNSETGQITTFTPKIRPGTDDAIIAYEEKAAQILAQCVKPGMEQWQIALAIHDRLIVDSAYDDSREKTLAYDLLVEGTSVCAGYALAYQDLLQRAGIDCLYVVSTAMDHAWNMVKLRGNWYHVDVTWDDPTPNIPGYVDHKYFLKTDAEFKSGEDPHYDWDVTTPCTDTGFADGFWNDIKSAIWYESADTSYLLRSDDYLSYIYRRNENTGEETLIHKQTDSNAMDIGKGSYKYPHHGLALRDGRLWFSSAAKVRSVKTDGSDLQTHYTNTGKTYVYSFYPTAQQLHLALNDHDGNRTEKTVTITASTAHVCSFTRTVVEPTDTQDGYTLSKCDCGIEAKSLPTPSGQWLKTTSSGQWQQPHSDSQSSADAAESAEDEAKRNFIITAVIGLIVVNLIRRGKKRK